MIPGEVFPASGSIVINAGREPVTISVTNTADRPIQVGSHFHFFEVNRGLQFDRSLGYGRRLDIPSGTATRFEPGEAKDVELIPFGGRGIVRGLNGLTDGPLSERRTQALEKVQQLGFGGDSDAS